MQCLSRAAKGTGSTSLTLGSLHSRRLISFRFLRRRQPPPSWLIWGPAFGFSSCLLGIAVASSIRGPGPNGHYLYSTERPRPVKEEENTSVPESFIPQEIAKWSKDAANFSQEVTDLFVERDGRPDAKEGATSKASSILGWNGLSFLKSALPIQTLADLTTSWAWPESLAAIQSRASALLLELGRGPGSLYNEVVESAADPSLYPECEWDAEVRLGDELGIGEKAFLKERRRKMRVAFAKLVGVDIDQVDERDIPIVAIAGSGGGYRAMTNTIGSLIGAKTSGVLDCVTYISGISGSCWSLAVLYSGVTGDRPDPHDAAQHLKKRISQSYLDISTLDLLTTTPTNKYLLSGLLLKAAAPATTVSLVDIYGTLVSSRLLVPSNLSNLDPSHLSLSRVRRFIEDGGLPMPIFTAIKHEIPLNAQQPLRDIKEAQKRTIRPSRLAQLKEEEDFVTSMSRYLWFEFTPYECGCDELGAWIPTWSLGRTFNNGKSTNRLPELSLTIQAGIYGSAFCATLNHYFAEIQPILRQLPIPLFQWLKEIIAENEKDLESIHAVLPNQVPNPLYGLDGQLRSGSPEDITKRETLGFMDAGAELNIPYYPLLRRNVDCIIALDASAEGQDLWFTRAEEYAARRGLATWPRGARWPAHLTDPDSPSPTPPTSAETSAAVDAGKDAEAEAANRLFAESQESQVVEQANKRQDTGEREMPDVDLKSEGETSSGDESAATRTPRGKDGEKKETPSATRSDTAEPLSSCSIWIGSSKDDSMRSHIAGELNEEELAERDGIGIVYMPLVPNKNVTHLHPMDISTWRREMNEEEVQELLNLAQMNFISGEDKIKTVLKAMWLRKRRERMQLEANRTGWKLANAPRSTFDF